MHVMYPRNVLNVLVFAVQCHGIHIHPWEVCTYTGVYALYIYYLVLLFFRDSDINLRGDYTGKVWGMYVRTSCA